MFLDEKYKIEENKQNYTNFIFKVLPQYLELNDRKKLKEEIVNIKLLSQMNDDLIPSFENEDYIYRNIMYIEFTVKNINKVQSYIEILHKLFKAPTILKISDNKLSCIYSLCIKRLSKINKNENVLEDIVITEEFSNIINSKKKEEYENILNNVINRNNKFEYYFELFIKTKIYTMKKELGSNYIKLLESKIFYDIEKMQYNLNNVNLLEEYFKKYKQETNLAEKVELKNKINNIVFIY